MKYSDEPKPTPRAILEAGERHFAEYGFAGASIRSIVKDANVNLAAVHYHFDSKEGLFSAVLGRYAKPIVQAQLANLDRTGNSSWSELERLLRAFYEPPLQVVKAAGAKSALVSQLLARAHTEFEPVSSIANSHFGPAIEAYSAKLKQATGLSDQEVGWNFQFVVGIVVSFLIGASKGDDNWTVDEALERLVRFGISGLSGGSKNG
jgi:AcrR family transcriptional regulator